MGKEEWTALVVAFLGSLVVRFLLARYPTMVAGQF